MALDERSRKDNRLFGKLLNDLLIKLRLIDGKAV